MTDERFRELTELILATDRRIVEVISSEINMDAHADRALKALDRIP